MLACILCGKEFQQRVQGANKFCSLDCAHKHRQQYGELYRRKSLSTCIKCGREYRPTRDHQQFCSRACHDQDMRDAPKTGVYAPCTWCGKEVYRLKSRLRGAKNFFCNQECQGYYQSKYMQELAAQNVIKRGEGDTRVPCTNCGKLFHPKLNSLAQNFAKFCSRECSKRFLRNPQDAVDLGLLVKKTCIHCSKEFEIDKDRAPFAKYCSRACYHAASAHTRGAPTTFRYIALRDFPQKCMMCGFDITIEVHHILPRSQGGKNEIENLVVLCPNHHAMADRGLISTQELLAINAEVRAKIS